MQRPAKKRVAGFEGRIGKRIGGLENARVVIGIVPAKREPAEGARLHGKVHAASASEISIEKIAGAERASEGNRAGSETDHIAKATSEVIGGETQPAGAEKLLETAVVGAAVFRAQRGIARIAGIGGERLLEPGFLDALAIGGAQPPIPPKALAGTQHESSAGTRNHAGAKTAVGFGARAGVQRNAEVRLKTRVKKAGLVVAVRVKRTGKTVFHLIRVTRSDNTLAVVERELLLKTGAVQLIDKSKKRRIGADVENTRFRGHQPMFPMRAGMEIPIEICSENVQRVAG